MTVKVGKAVAIAVGGSIILLQVANEQGYINVNWDKLASKTDKLMDKVEERVTGEGPNLLDKVRIKLRILRHDVIWKMTTTVWLSGDLVYCVCV